MCICCILRSCDPARRNFQTFDDLVRAGKVRYVGCSNFHAWEVMKALGISERERLDALPGRREQLVDCDARSSNATWCRSHARKVWASWLGVRCSAACSPGNTSATVRPISLAVAADACPAILDHNKVHDIVDVMREIAQAHSVTPAEIALAFLLREKVDDKRDLRLDQTRASRLEPRASGLVLSEEEIGKLEDRERNQARLRRVDYCAWTARPPAVTHDATTWQPSARWDPQ